MSRGLLLAAALLASFAGCREAAPPAQLATEEVGASPTDHLGPDGDRVAEARAPELVGVAPSSFPSDFPLFAPASVVDFGGAGPRFLHLRTTEPRSAVERFLLRRAPAAGWSERGGAWHKGEAEVRVRIEQRRAGDTLIVLEY